MLIAPLLATAGVAVFASAPRSPVVFCRFTGQFFNNLTYSANAHRGGTDDAADAIVLVDEAGQVLAHAPAARQSDWAQIRAAAVRLEATGAASAPDETQGAIGGSLQRAYRDFRARCATLLTSETVAPLDLGGLIGQPPEVAYCQRALTFFSDVVANSQGADRYTRDRLLAEAERVVKLSPAPLSTDWAATVEALTRLQRSGSTVDAAHPQGAVDATLNRLADDYASRCPTPIPAPPA